MKNKTSKIIIILMCIFLLSGCTKTLKDKDKNAVVNEATGQSITENIICKPNKIKNNAYINPKINNPPIT